MWFDNGVFCVGIHWVYNNNKLAVHSVEMDSQLELFVMRPNQSNECLPEKNDNVLGLVNEQDGLYSNDQSSKNNPHPATWSFF
mgnify:CR=1 FL=1